MSKLFSIKSLSPANDWFAVLDKNGSAEFQRVVAWVVLDNHEKDDEVAAAVNSDGEGIVLVGEFYDELAGYVHRSELHAVAERFSLKIGTLPT